MAPSFSSFSAAFIASRRTLRMATLPSSPSLLTVLTISLRRSCSGGSSSGQGLSSSGRQGLEASGGAEAASSGGSGGACQGSAGVSCGANSRRQP